MRGMKHHLDAQAAKRKTWWIGHLRAVGYVSATFFLINAS